MTYKSEDIKKMNSMSLLKELNILKNATMSELVNITHFSQSSVRSILSLQKIDQSSGGRCSSIYIF